MATGDGVNNLEQVGLGNKRPVPASAERANEQPKDARASAASQLTFSHPPTPTILFRVTAGLTHAPVPPAVLITNSNKELSATAEHQSSPDSSDCLPTEQLPEASQTDPTIPPVAAAAEELNPESPEGDVDSEWDPDVEASKQEEIDAALNAMTLHKEAALVRTQDVDKTRITQMIAEKKQQTMIHALIAIVLPSVALASGREIGRMEKRNRADPSSKSFQKGLESMLLQLACLQSTEVFEFERTKKCHVKNGIPSVSKYIIRFQSRRPIARMLSSKPATFKKNFSLKFTEKKMEELPPFEGQPYHVQKVRGFWSNDFIGLGDYEPYIFYGYQNW